MGKREGSGAPSRAIRCPALPRIAAAIVAAVALGALACQPDPTPTSIPLASPSGVTADAADRNLTVSWSPVGGAASYVVAARFANGVEPLPWSEYDAPASPYVIADNWAAMSGLEYEVRVSSVNADGRSEWSPAATATAPELAPAPAGAIGVATDGPYAVGDWMEVNLFSQRPFTRRAPFVWSLCDADGTRCKALPIFKPSTYSYLISESARGKLARVQVDYDKDGASYTATATLGVVSADAPGPAIARPTLPPGCEEAAPPSAAEGLTRDADLPTHLHLLESWSVQLEEGVFRAGAAEPLCNDLLAATSRGEIALIDPGGRIERLDGNVPMNLEGLLSHPDSATFYPEKLRVADILLRQRTEEVWELFVTHHYFTGECVLFRLSSTTVVRDGAAFSVSPSWRTIFDAAPCLPPADHSGDQGGGKMLTDGPDHLLIVIGDHAKEQFVEDPDSHLGKLVRVAIETGEAEILALGFRNPQGFARDADGNLWQTEHGPKGGDELNLLESGANYGYPSVSYGVSYQGTVITGDNESIGSHEGYAKPRFAWTPAIGVSAIIVNDPRWFPLWKDDLLVASLTGSGSGGLALFRVRRDGTDVKYVERIEVNYRIRDLTQMPDGRIVLLADGGRVHFLSRSLTGCDARADELARRRGEPRLIYYAGCGAYASDAFGGMAGRGGAGAPGPNDGAATPPDGAELYAANCASCHSLGVEEHGVGPHLVGLIGRQAGEVKGYNASDALRKFGGVWTTESLAEFLADPQAFAPGAAMSSQGLSEEEAQAIADYVAGLPGE